MRQRKPAVRITVACGGFHPSDDRSHSRIRSVPAVLRQAMYSSAPGNRIAMIGGLLHTSPLFYQVAGMGKRRSRLRLPMLAKDAPAMFITSHESPGLMLLNNVIFLNDNCRIAVPSGFVGRLRKLCGYCFLHFARSQARSVRRPKSAPAHRVISYQCFRLSTRLTNWNFMKYGYGQCHQACIKT